MKSLALVLSLILAPVMAQAQTYQSFNLLTVVPLGGGDFEVIEARGEGPRGIWCAASDFALHGLGSPRDNRLYIKRPRGPSVSGVGQTGVVFTLDPTGLEPRRAYSVGTGQKGLGLPVHHAHQFCKDYQIELQDILN